MRLLQGLERNRHVLVAEMLAGIGERVGGQPRADAAERIDENLARPVVLDLVVLELERRDAAADADLEASLAQVIENADFLDQPQRRIERQQVDQRPEADAAGRARNRAEIDARYRNHVERRRM